MKLKRVFLAVAFVLSLFTFPQVALVAPIPQGGTGVTYNPATGTLFLISGGQVSQYDRGGSLISQFNIGDIGFGNGIAADQEGNLYITDEGPNNNAGKLLKLAPKGNGQYEVVFTKDILSKLRIAPDDLTFDPETGHLFISSLDGGNKVFEVTADGEAVVNSFVVGGGTGYGITLATSGSHRGNLFLTDYTDKPEFRIIETTRSGARLHSYSLTGGRCPGDGIAFDPTTEKLWVADYCGNTVLEADISTLTVETTSPREETPPTQTPGATSPLPGATGIPRGATGITYNPVTDTLFFVNGMSPIFEANRNGNVIGTFGFDIIGFGNGIAADPQGNLYVADRGAEFSGTGRSKVGKLHKFAATSHGGYELVFTKDIWSNLSIMPDDIVFDPETGHLFISSSRGGKVFEVTSDGEEIVNSFSVAAAVGDGITLVTSGSSRGNLLLTTTTNRPGINIIETTRAGAPLRYFSFAGGQCPWGVAFDPITEKLWVADVCTQQVFDVEFSKLKEELLPTGLVSAPQEFRDMIAAPTDPTQIVYPDFYQNVQPATGQLSDPYCIDKSDVIYYPKDYLGEFPLPALRGGPLPLDIKRGVNTIDGWRSFAKGGPRSSSSEDNPSFNEGCSGNLHSAYLETLRRIKLLGADHISVVNYTWVQDANATTPKVDLRDEWLEITESEMAFITEEAYKNNLGVHLWLQIPSQDERGKLLPTAPTREWVAAYLDSYSDFAFQQAQWAQKYNIEAMTLNHFDYEVIYWQFKYPDIIASKLLALLTRVRSVYNGKIILYDNFGSVDHDQRIDQLFSNADLIYFTLAEVGPWPGLSDKENANLNTNLVLEKYNIQLRALAQRYASYSKPGVVRVLVQSHRDFMQIGWIEDCCCTNGCIQRSLRTDFSVQAIAFEAAFEALSKIHNHGLVIYSIEPAGYWFADTILPKDSFPNTAQSIRNKPTESIVSYWYSRSNEPASTTTESAPDSDGDGVPDAQNFCPAFPGKPEANGC